MKSTGNGVSVNLNKSIVDYKTLCICFTNSETATTRCCFEIPVKVLMQNINTDYGYFFYALHFIKYLSNTSIRWRTGNDDYAYYLREIYGIK